MPTIMEFIVAQSSLPIGNTIRDHIENPSTSGPGGNLILLDGLEIEMEDTNFEIELDVSPLEIEIDSKEFEIELEPIEFEIEVS